MGQKRVQLGRTAFEVLKSVTPSFPRDVKLSRKVGVTSSTEKLAMNLSLKLTGPHSSEPPSRIRNSTASAGAHLRGRAIHSASGEVPYTTPDLWNEPLAHIGSFFISVSHCFVVRTALLRP